MLHFEQLELPRTLLKLTSYHDETRTHRFLGKDDPFDRAIEIAKSIFRYTSRLPLAIDNDQASRTHSALPTDKTLAVATMSLERRIDATRHPGAYRNFRAGDAAVLARPGISPSLDGYPCVPNSRWLWGSVALPVCSQACGRVSGPIEPTGVRSISSTLELCRFDRCQILEEQPTNPHGYCFQTGCNGNTLPPEQPNSPDGRECQCPRSDNRKENNPRGRPPSAHYSWTSAGFSTAVAASVFPRAKARHRPPRPFPRLTPSAQAARSLAGHPKTSTPRSYQRRNRYRNSTSA
jgi:hypothetical protein